MLIYNWEFPYLGQISCHRKFPDIELTLYYDTRYGLFIYYVIINHMEILYSSFLYCRQHLDRSTASMYGCGKKIINDNSYFIFCLLENEVPIFCLLTKKFSNNAVRNGRGVTLLEAFLFETLEHKNIIWTSSKKTIDYHSMPSFIHCFVISTLIHNHKI